MPFTWDAVLITRLLFSAILIFVERAVVVDRFVRSVNFSRFGAPGQNTRELGDFSEPLPERSHRGTNSLNAKSPERYGGFDRQGSPAW